MTITSRRLDDAITGERRRDQRLAGHLPADRTRGRYWSDRQPKEPSAAALDVDAARQQWDLSEQLVGLSA